MEKIEIIFLKNCCTTKRQFKEGKKIEININTNGLPDGKDIDMKDLFHENKEQKYFKIQEEKKEEIQEENEKEEQGIQKYNNKLNNKKLNNKK